MNGYERIKRLAKDTRCNIPDLLVLARQNDPFFAGSDTTKAMAEWFADLWQRFGYTNGIHLRRVHYQLVSQGNAKKHNGLPYENTENDWNYLCNAGKYARYLGLVNPAAFVDRRNPEPHIFRPYEERPEKPGWDYVFPPWYLPEINADLVADLDWDLPGYRIYGYTYSEGLQPYHLELWVEKSTMDDVLVPLCRRYGVNLVTGLGFMSITSVVELLKRVRTYGKPCRIFYVSDFDPAGDGMPTAVARQIEYWLTSYGLGLEADIKLRPLALTREQVIEYRLPRIPIKDSDRRKEGFEERYGEGAVELDALEALRPGELARIVRENILQFRDNDLEERVAEARERAERELESWWEAWIEPYRKELESLKERTKAVMQKYQARLEQLAREVREELAPYKAELDSLRQAIQDTIACMDPELPDVPEPKVEGRDEGDWLFDSRRDYFAQLSAYKNWKERVKSVR